MKSAKSIFIALVSVFMLCEVYFTYQIILEGADELGGTLLKTLFLLIFILLYARRLSWARWPLSVWLGLYSLLNLLVAIQAEYYIFYFIALFHMFFAIIIHASPVLREYYSKPREKKVTVVGELSSSPDSFLSDSREFKYPFLVKRYKALLIDGALLLAVLIILMIITEDMDNRTPIMVTCLALALLVYEPFLTVYSKTVGQRVMGIAVRQFESPDKRINIVQAYIRIVVKGFLGWLSFITINFNDEHRAIHDFASDSVMIED